MTTTQEMYKRIKQDIVTSGEKTYASRVAMYENGVVIVFGIDPFTRLRSVCFNFEGAVGALKFPSWKGIRYEHIELPCYPNLKSLVRFSQEEEADSEIFEIVVEDLRKNAESLKSYEKILSSVQFTLNKWRKFFQQNRELILSPEMQQGLFGELTFLKECISEYGIESVKYWSGAEKLSKDFYFDSGSAAEVKTSRANADPHIHISNTEQLDEKDIAGNLVLRVYLVREDNSGFSDTLPDVVKVIRNLLIDDCMNLSLFDEKLNKYGYYDAAENVYNTGYHVKDSYYYHVKDGFPRICGNDLTKGVCNVLYSIDLATCMQYAATRTEAFNLLRGEVNGR